VKITKLLHVPAYTFYLVKMANYNVHVQAQYVMLSGNLET